MYIKAVSYTHLDVYKRQVQKIRKKTSNTYRVKYEGDNGVQRIDVKVKRRGLTWKVDEADTFLSKNFSVAVPKGAEIKIDGITPDSKLKSQDEIEGMDTYTIKTVSYTHLECNCSRVCRGAWD